MEEKPKFVQPPPLIKIGAPVRGYKPKFTKSKDPYATIYLVLLFLGLLIGFSLGFMIGGVYATRNLP